MPEDDMPKPPLVWRMYPEVLPALVGREVARIEVTYEAWYEGDRKRRSDLFCKLSDMMFQIRTVEQKGKALSTFRYWDAETETFVLLFFSNEKPS